MITIGTVIGLLLLIAGVLGVWQKFDARVAWALVGVAGLLMMVVR